MLKQAALHFVAQAAIAAETSADDAGDLALGGALARALDGVDDTAHKAAWRGGGLVAAAMDHLAGDAEIAMKRDANHGWSSQCY
jgi:hypothetical protein